MGIVLVLNEVRRMDEKLETLVWRVVAKYLRKVDFGDPVQLTVI